MPETEQHHLFRNLKEAAHLIHKGKANSPTQAAEIVHRKRTERVKRAVAHKDWANAKRILSRLPAHTTKSRNALAHLIHVANAAHEIDKAIKAEESKFNPKNRGTSRRYKKIVKNLSHLVGTTRRR